MEKNKSESTIRRTTVNSEALNRGKCVEPEFKTPDDFFAKPGTPAARRAIELCKVCPVNVECLEAAISLSPEADSEQGIKAGLFPEHRRMLRAQRIF